jgi:hypothetical protein
MIMPIVRKIGSVEKAIYCIRDERVMLDSDLAAIYGVTTRRLNEQLRRNRSRFPEDFAFQLTAWEFRSLKSQFATSSSPGAAMAELFPALKALLQPPTLPRRREIGFRVRERSGRCRESKRF